MKKTAFLFPGQGSQSVGMGQEFYREYDTARELFDMIEEITRINISRLCFKGPMEDLTQTVNLQSAVTAVNLACLAAIEKEYNAYHFCVGHSLGEYSALNAAGVISREDIIRLVFKRGELMHRDATRHQGVMHAIVGLPIDEVCEMVSEGQKEGVVSVANHNTELQIVITGAEQPVARVSALASAKGAKSVPLKVSGAWHSALIKDLQGRTAGSCRARSIPDCPRPASAMSPSRPDSGASWRHRYHPCFRNNGRDLQPTYRSLLQSRPSWFYRSRSG